MRCPAKITISSEPEQCELPVNHTGAHVSIRGGNANFWVPTYYNCDYIDIFGLHRRITVDLAKFIKTGDLVQSAKYRLEQCKGEKF